MGRRDVGGGERSLLVRGESVFPAVRKSVFLGFDASRFTAVSRGGFAIERALRVLAKGHVPWRGVGAAEVASSPLACRVAHQLFVGMAIAWVLRVRMSGKFAFGAGGWRARSASVGREEAVMVVRRL